MTRILYCFLISLLTLHAAEISGKWSGTVQIKTPDGEAMTVPLTADLRQNGQELVGTIGRQPTEKQPIQKGKVDGAKVSFEVSTSDSGTPFKFDLSLAAAGLEGEMRGQLENGPITGKVALTRGD